MIHVPSSDDRIVILGDFEGFTPEDLFDHWVDPVRLVQWWPQVASVEPKVGGHYRFDWPQPGDFLFGEYRSFDRGRRLGFTWSWNCEPNVHEPLLVDIFFEPLDGGTRIGIHHGPFGPADHAERQGVIEGWIHYGMLLAGLRTGEGL